MTTFGLGDTVKVHGLVQGGNRGDYLWSGTIVATDFRQQDITDPTDTNVRHLVVPLTMPLRESGLWCLELQLVMVVSARTDAAWDRAMKGI